MRKTKHTHQTRKLNKNEAEKEGSKPFLENTEETFFCNSCILMRLTSLFTGWLMLVITPG